jgi:hypothetical protein
MLRAFTTDRCTAPADDLDAEAGRRSHAHTSALIEQYSSRILWDDYGVVGHMVSLQSCLKYAHHHF